MHIKWQDLSVFDDYKHVGTFDPLYIQCSKKRFQYASGPKAHNA